LATAGIALIGIMLALAPAAMPQARAAELVVSAATSLTNALREIGANFGRASPGDQLTFNFAASDVLLTQIARGAPAEHRKCGLAALADASYRRIASGNPATVPAGRYAKAALEKAGLWTALQAKLVPTQNVRQSLDYVARGECDAGFVYATDGAILPDRVTVAFEVASAVPMRYPIAVVRGTGNAGLAARFIVYLGHPSARAVLARYGFGPP